MSTYLAITKQDMTAFLESLGFTLIHLPNTKEMVYGKVIKKDICLRIYTSISQRSDVARRNGGDAIRCLVVRRYVKATDGKNYTVRPIMKEAKRVFRVTGWKKNLQARIEELTKEFGEKQ